jgi:molybdate transport system regulatory protein
MPASATIDDETNDPRERPMADHGDATDAPCAAPRLRLKVWIEDERGAVLLSEWRVALLEAVEATGAMSRAAEAVGVPYRTAWARLREMEAALGTVLVDTASGGGDGGGSRLTPAGRDLVARFRLVTAGLTEAANERFDAHLRDRLGNAGDPA